MATKGSDVSAKELRDLLFGYNTLESTSAKIENNSIYIKHIRKASKAMGISIPKIKDKKLLLWNLVEGVLGEKIAQFEEVFKED